MPLINPSGGSLPQALSTASSPSFVAENLTGSGVALSLPNGIMDMQGVQLSPPDASGTLAIGQKVRTTDSPAFAGLSLESGGFLWVGNQGLTLAGHSLAITDGGNLTVNGHVSFDDGNISSDGNGNLTALGLLINANIKMDVDGFHGPGGKLTFQSEASAVSGDVCVEAVTNYLKVKP